MYMCMYMNSCLYTYLMFMQYFKAWALRLTLSFFRSSRPTTTDSIHANIVEQGCSQTQFKE